MSDTLTIKLKKVAGHVVQDHWPRSKTNLWVRFFGVALARLTVPQLSNRQIVAVSSNIAQLTRVTALEVSANNFLPRFVDAARRSTPMRSRRFLRPCFS